MATPSHRLHILTDGSVEVCQALPGSVGLPDVLYRVKHDVEMWRPNSPEVYRVDPDQHVVLTKEIQFLIRDMNPTWTGDQFRLVLDNKTAFTNFTGFPGRHDYINNIDADKHDPAFDHVRVCGGALLKGVKQGEELLIEAIDAFKPLPTAQYIMERPWLYFEAVTVDYSVSLGSPIIRPLKVRWNKPVYIPILYSYPLTFPLDLLTEIQTASGIPSPYRYP